MIRSGFKKAAAAVLVMLIVVLAFGVTAGASGDYESVYDYAGVFSDYEQAELQSHIEQAEKATGFDISVLTIYDADGKSTRGYGADFYEANNLGRGVDKTGVMYIFDFDNGEMYILTKSKALNYLTDGRINDMLDAAYVYAGEKDYYNATLSLIADTEYYYEQGEPEDLMYYDEDTGEYSRPKQGLTPMYVVIFLAIAVVVGLIVCAASRRGYTVATQKYYYDYKANSSLNLNVREDRHIDTRRSTRRIPRASGGGGGGRSGGFRGGGSTSTTFHSSSGGSFGGGGRKL
ncbi:MAG: TPM domain-containing protein [Clostridia bacterium]|nr:TPM domain-containing protein [Clostridia bacterium]